MNTRVLAVLMLLASCASPPPPPAATSAPATAPSPVSALPTAVWSSASAIEARCEAARATIEGERRAVRDAATPDEALVLVPLNRLFTELDTALSWMSLITSTHPSKEIRDAAEACDKSLKQLASELWLDRGLFDVVQKVDKTPLDAETQRFLFKIVRDFKRSGVDKDEKVRAELAELKKKMIDVGQIFDRNIRDDVRSIDVDPKELEGLPEDFIAAHKPNEAGRVVLTTNYPDFFPVQTYAKNTEVRRRLLVAFFNRAAPANDVQLKTLLELRDTYAKTLGYPSWAEYQAEDKMVKSGTAIKKFVDQLAKLARPRMQKDIKDLLVRKKVDDKGAKSVEVWDRFYYVDRVRNERYDFDTKAVRSYFEFTRVLDGLFALYGELFNLRFERTPEAAVWHESVIAFRMYSGDRAVGRFYLDLHPRDGKYGHAAMFPLVTGLQGGPEPEASLVCNFPDPSKSGGKALMEHSDVRTFFHEFGHLIHHLLASNSRYINQSGINVEWDFVEAPSQLLEEWVWDPTVLARFAKHVDTDEPIPAALVAKMRAAEEFGKGVAVMRQLKFAAMSYELHAKDPKSLSLGAFMKDLDKRYSPFPYVPGTFEYASFGHLEGYSSMYYTYQWSLVLAKDIFTRFAKSGLLDQATAAEYARTILAPGGTKDAASLVKDFLGRDTNLDAYKAWLEEG